MTAQGNKNFSAFDRDSPPLTIFNDNLTAVAKILGTDQFTAQMKDNALPLHSRLNLIGHILILFTQYLGGTL